MNKIIFVYCILFSNLLIAEPSLQELFEEKRPKLQEGSQLLTKEMCNVLVDRQYTEMKNLVDHNCSVSLNRLNYISKNNNEIYINTLNNYSKLSVAYNDLSRDNEIQRQQLQEYVSIEKNNTNSIVIAVSVGIIVGAVVAGTIVYTQMPKSKNSSQIY